MSSLFEDLLSGDVSSAKGTTGGSRRKSLRQIMQEGRQNSNRENNGKMNPPILNDPYENTNNLKGVFRKETAYCYLPNNNHFSPWDSNFPECPRRSKAVNESILPIFYRLKTIYQSEMLKMSDVELLTLVHTLEHVMNVREICEDSEEETAQLYDSIYFNGEDSYAGAVEAVRLTVTMAKLVADGQVQNGFANIRPPGHHATSKVPNGYCFFNNVAIAAKYLLNQKLAERILIIDYDVHHGQGTQRFFYDTDSVLYFSIHRYEHGTFWPNLEESNFHYVGIGRGEGYNINVPLNNTGLTDFDYLSIIINVLLPVAYEYNPSIILISAGYDACIGCPEGRMNVTPAFYAHLIALLGGLAEGKILVVLEGGYFIPSLGEAALKTVQALLNDPSPPLEYHSRIDSSVIDSINNVKVVLRPYWKCFNQIDSTQSIKDIIKYDKYNNHVAIVRHVGTTEKPPFPTRHCYAANSTRMNAMFEAKLQFIKDRYDFLETHVGYMKNTEAFLHNPPADQRAQEVQLRLTDIMNKLQEHDLIRFLIPVEFEYNLEGENENNYPKIWADVEEAIKRTHCESYLKDLMKAEIQQKPDLYCTPHSEKVCHYSCANLCQIVSEISSKTITHGIGFVRPPGHHARHGEGGGFCLINNVVVTANFAIYKLGMKKVLILDFDVHHGDGTQDLTYSKENIMYISMHRFDQGKFFPKDLSGDFICVGEGRSAGYNLNIPFENAKMSNAEYLFTWMKVVLPISYSFNPDLILVSAGFDAGINDPLGGYNVHPEVFGHFIQMIKPIAPVLLALEGGYNLETTSLGMVNCVKALVGHPLPMPTIEDVAQEAAITMANSIAVMKPFWPIMEVNKILDRNVRFQRDLDSAIKSTKEAVVYL